MKITYVLLVCLSFSATAVAAIKTPSCFSDHMLLQRDQVVPVWGTAKPGATVAVSFADQRQTAVAEADGKWQVQLKPMPASDQPRDLTLAEDGGASKVVFTDVLVGDIWLGAGQSNMAWTMQHVLDTKEFKPEVLARVQQEVTEANHSSIRLYYPPRLPAYDGNKWLVCSPETVLHCSAVGYYFVREVLRDQKVPVGFISAGISGSRIEPWISSEAFGSSEVFKGQITSGTSGAPTIDGEPIQNLYNRCMRHWPPFALKGILWYQGESNILKGDKPSRYAAKMELLIKSWREAWGRKDLPFYFVQLPWVSYSKTKSSNATPETLPTYQDIQRRLLCLPHTGMAMTADEDDGRPGDLHPRNKWEVGRRLWLWAAWDTYGKKQTVPSGPLFKRLEARDQQAVLFFDHVGSGLMARDNKPLTGFEIRGQDGVYYPGNAAIRGSEVVVSNPQVQRPVAVRYNWNESAARSLFNKEGLPASPFSTEPGITDPPLPNPATPETLKPQPNTAI